MPTQHCELASELFEQQADVSEARRKPWAWLLRHVFAVDVSVCPRCAEPMKWREVALMAEAIRAGLARAGLLARGSPKARRVPLGQLSCLAPAPMHRCARWSKTIDGRVRSGSNAGDARDRCLPYGLRS